MRTDQSDPFGVRQGARTTQRRGRMTATRHAVLADLGPTWLVDPAEVAAIDALDQVFGRRAPRLLDVGAGNGEAARHWAADHPDHDVVAVELHRPGLARLVKDLDAEGPPNVRATEADALAVLHAAPPRAFAQIRVLFPDPWPKRRHVGRRLVDPGFVRLATDRLAEGGTLHLATDWADYAQQMRASVATEPRLRPEVDVVDPEPVADPGSPGGPAAVLVAGGPRWRTHRPHRPITAYEARGLDAGRAIVDLVAVRRP